MVAPQLIAVHYAGILAAISIRSQLRCFFMASLNALASAFIKTALSSVCFPALISLRYAF